MGRPGRRVGAVIFALGLTLLVAGPAWAHEGGEGTSLQIDPNPVTAGHTVTLVGNGLEANDSREVSLAGPNGLLIDFGKFSTDADGMLKADLKLPAYLPGGTYEIRAAGDEVLTVECDVQAAAGMPASDDASPQLSVVPRQRGAIEVAVIGSLVALCLALGSLLVWRTRPRPQGE